MRWALGMLLLVTAIPVAADTPAPPTTRPATATAPKDPLEAARETMKADRQVAIAGAMTLTDSEARDFWPVYHQYRAAMDIVGDQLVALIQDYAKALPDLSEDDARDLARDYLAVEKRYLETRAKYFRTVGEVLPATKTLRFIQLENRLDLALRLQLAAQIPLAVAGSAD